jgi:tetratricopeptide (TPR) repeat protein
LAYFGEGIQIRESLVRQEPDNARYKRDLAIAHFFAGRAYLKLGDPHKAMEHLDQFLPVVQERVNANPQDARSRRDLASAHDFVGQAYAMMREMDKARSSYESFQRIIVPLSQSDPENTGYRELVSESQRRFGELACAEGRLDEGIEHYREALRIIDRLTNDDPDNVLVKIGRATLLVQLGTALARADEAPLARQRLEAAQLLFEELRETQPANAVLEAGLAETRQGLAHLDNRSG